MRNIIVATIKEWNIDNYMKLKHRYSSKFYFHLITSNEELTTELAESLNPIYIFFPHWSWMIDSSIFLNYESIVFHMTDLPFGRGGSPLQNLIEKEIYNTKISALRVDHGIDTGDIYLKENLNIEYGSAQDIFIKASYIVFEKMIPKIIESNISPIKQKGKIVNFKRRTEKQSDFTSLKNASLKNIYDFIRMLDADGYPKAYIKVNNVKIEFYEAELEGKKLIGKFEVIKDA